MKHKVIEILDIEESAVRITASIFFFKKKIFVSSIRLYHFFDRHEIFHGADVTVSYVPLISESIDERRANDFFLRFHSWRIANVPKVGKFQGRKPTSGTGLRYISAIDDALRRERPCSLSNTEHVRITDFRTDRFGRVFGMREDEFTRDDGIGRKKPAAGEWQIFDGGMVEHDLLRQREDWRMEFIF